MVAHFTMRTYGVNKENRFVEGIRLLRKSRQIRGKKSGKNLNNTCATCSEPPSYISTMNYTKREKKYAHQDNFFLIRVYEEHSIGKQLIRANSKFGEPYYF